ncbi:MAG: hypothetical protein AB7K36_21005 [Chloroflexota bacterium]
MLQLDIFVSPHCFGCQEARRLAEAVARRFLNVAVRVIDLEARPELKPEQVIAVPAYLLGRRVIALGNPRESDLYQQLEEALAAEQVHQP